MTMNKMESYPIFEADQVLTNSHLNDTVSYLERQDRLSRIRLVGQGIVCGLEITVSDEGLTIDSGHGITSQGYLIEHCRTDYTHVGDYTSPNIPKALNLLTDCGKEPAELPYYDQDGVLELLPAGAEVADKRPVSGLTLDNYVVVLFLEARQVRLKNCDTNDCNDKGGRLEFRIRPLLVHVDLFEENNPPAFDALMLKRYGVPTTTAWPVTGDQVLRAFHDIVDDDTLEHVEQQLRRCWERYAPLFGLKEVNPFAELNLKVLRDGFNYLRGTFHYIQYFYDFVDDLIKAINEFLNMAGEFTGGCPADIQAFPLHLALGKASESTRFGYRDRYRNYFVPIHYLYGHGKLRDEAVRLLYRLKYMVEAFDGTLPSRSRQLTIIPNHIGRVRLSERSIPFYYQLDLVRPWWKDARGVSPDRGDTDNDSLLYDIERFNAFRIEGHVGKPYTAALSEIVAERDKFNLPFDVVALSAATLEQVVSGNRPTCQVQDLESDYNVLIAGLLCRLKQILAYVGGLRPKTSRPVKDLIGDITAVKIPNLAGLALSDRVAAIRKQTVKHPVDLKNGINYLGTLIDFDLSDVEDKEAEVKLVDFVSVDLNTFLVKGRKEFEYALARPDLLVVFLQQLNKIIGYLIQHDLHMFDTVAYRALWNLYQDTVNSIIAEAPNSQDERIKDYFSPQNTDVLFACVNEELFALKEEYAGRLERYQEAVTFASYFEKHKGLEHKAGVPKGGTFVLVYEPPVSLQETPTSPGHGIKETDQPMITDLSGMTVSTGRKLSVANLTVEKTAVLEEAVGLMEQLNVDVDLLQLRKLLNDRRTTIERGVNRPSAGTVIADFYVPYMCKSNCPPVAYVFQPEPDKPVDPEQPEEKPKVEVKPETFCADDTKMYAIHVSPEGGKLTINGKESRPEFIPAKLGSGIFTVVYTLESGAQVTTSFTIEAIPNATFEVKSASYSGREHNWTLTLVSVADVERALWLMDGKLFAENKPDVEILLTPNQPKTEVKRTIPATVCGAAEYAMVIVRQERIHTVDATADEVILPVDTKAEVYVLTAPKGVTIKEGRFVLSPIQLIKDGLEQVEIVFYYTQDKQATLAVWTVRFVSARFEIVVTPEAQRVLTRGTTGESKLTITLTPVATEGTSTWTFNGKAAKDTIVLTQAEFENLREIVITHRLAFKDGGEPIEAIYRQSIDRVMKQLEAGKGRIVVG